jgi:hypothetical protein
VWSFFARVPAAGHALACIGFIWNGDPEIDFTLPCDCARAFAERFAAIKKAKSTDGKKIAQSLEGLSIDSPFGANGKLTMRAQDHTVVDYALAWGELSGKEPFMKSPVPGSWNQITELEAEWKKRKGFA